MGIISTRVRRRKKRKPRGYERCVVISGHVSAKVVKRLLKRGAVLVQKGD